MARLSVTDREASYSRSAVSVGSAIPRPPYLTGKEKSFLSKSDMDLPTRDDGGVSKKNGTPYGHKKTEKNGNF